MPRPYTMTDRNDYVLNFYPEGGSRAKGVEQYIAYQLTDGLGNGMNDTLQLCDGEGNVMCEFQRKHPMQAVLKSLLQSPKFADKKYLCFV